MDDRLIVLSVVGTRPEVIKMAPVLQALARYPESVNSILVVSGQHREMLDETLKVFDLHPEVDLQVMKADQSLAHVTSSVITGMERIIEGFNPHCILVQGDTTTTFVGALAGFYARVPVGHLEAGLRTDDKTRPFPEEINRRLTSVIADIHFAPTKKARENLLREGVPEERTYVTGNTVIDALLAALPKAKTAPVPFPEKVLQGPGPLILVTAHRREHFGKPLEQVCEALRLLVSKYPDLKVIFPVHPNPSVQKSIRSRLKGHERILLTPPLDYLGFVRVMEAATLILTDSGGIQEEAPTLGKPVLVLREKTERPEAVAAGAAKVIGWRTEDVVRETVLLLDDEEAYSLMTSCENPYGDGKSGERIATILLSFSDELKIRNL